MKFEEVFGFKCGVCESIWYLDALTDTQIRFGHALYCGASRSELSWLKSLDWPDEAESAE